ncbi:MAG: AGE family epimerase/isomerase, partial [Brevundimonas sp.]|nr:AGE family epimerase/isomerase [Brevundimonas sp.]
TSGERRDPAPFRPALATGVRTAALPLWTTLGVHEDGAFAEAPDIRGPAYVRCAAGRAFRAARFSSSCRAGALGWSGPWRRTAEAGLQRFLAGYLRSDGAVRNALNPDGTVLDDTAVLYEQAFALLALATAHAAGVRPDLCERHAGILLDRLVAERPPAGGWREKRGSPVPGQRQHAPVRGRAGVGGPGC